MSTGNLSAIKPGQTLCSPSSSYSVLKFIGEGSFGKVAKCQKLSTKEIVAIKILKKDPKWEVDYEKEGSNFTIMSVLNPDTTNIVKFFECFVHKGWTCLVFEVLDMNLCELLRDRKCKPLNVSEIRPIAKQLLVALDALKGKGIIHTGIKPDNIMVVNKQEWPPRIKLIDFGEAMTAEEAEPGLELQVPAYRAPEMSLGLPFTEAIDAWSAGCVLAFLYLVNHLFPGNCDYRAMKRMVEFLGQPEDRHLRAGINTKDFFVEEGTAAGPSWRLMTPTEFLDANGVPPEKLKRKTKLPSSLDDLVNFYPKSGPAETEDRRAFVDLLKGLLHLDGDERITPCQALQHPYITMSHLHELPDSRDYVSAAEAMMSLWYPREETTPSSSSGRGETPHLSEDKNPLPLPEDKDPDPLPQDKDPDPLPEDKDPDPLPDDKDPDPLPEDKDPDPLQEDNNPPPLAEDTDPPPLQEDNNPPPLLEDKDPLPLPEDKDPDPLPEDKDPPPLPEDKDPPPLPEDKDPDPLPEDKDPPPLPEDKDPLPLPEDKDPLPLAEDKDPHPLAEDKDPLPLPVDRDPGPLTTSDGETPPLADDEYPESWASETVIPPHFYSEDLTSSFSCRAHTPLSDREHPEVRSCDGEKIRVSLNGSGTAWDNAGDLPPRSSAEDSLSRVSVDAPCSKDEHPAALPEPEAQEDATSASTGGTRKRLKRIRKFFRRIAKAFCCCCRAED